MISRVEKESMVSNTIEYDVRAWISGRTFKLVIIAIFNYYWIIYLSNRAFKIKVSR
jgi:hypothetical protein